MSIDRYFQKMVKNTNKNIVVEIQKIIMMSDICGFKSKKKPLNKTIIARDIILIILKLIVIIFRLLFPYIPINFPLIKNYQLNYIIELKSVNSHYVNSYLV